MCAYNFFYNLVILSFLKDGASAFISAKGQASNEKERVAWIASICKQRDVTQVGRETRHKERTEEYSDDARKMLRARYRARQRTRSREKQLFGNDWKPPLT